MDTASIRTLRLAHPGDSLVLVRQKTKYVGLYVVEARVTSRGRYGKTVLTLRNTLNDRTWSFKVGAKLPGGFDLCRLVSKGTHVRGTKVDAESAENVVEDTSVAEG